MDGDTDRGLFVSLIKDTEKPESDPISLTVEDDKELSDVV